MALQGQLHRVAYLERPTFVFAFLTVFREIFWLAFEELRLEIAFFRLFSLRPSLAGLRLAFARRFAEETCLLLGRRLFFFYSRSLLCRPGLRGGLFNLRGLFFLIGFSWRFGFAYRTHIEHTGRCQPVTQRLPSPHFNKLFEIDGLDCLALSFSF